MKRFSLVLLCLLFIQCVTSCTSWHEGEVKRTALGRLFASDQDGLRAVVDANPFLRRGDAAILLLTGAICRPGMVEFVLDDLGYTPERGGDVESMRRSAAQAVSVTGYGFRNMGGQYPCDAGLFLDSLTRLLEAGADPCVDQEGDSVPMPASRAAADGWPQPVVDLIAEYSSACSG